MVTAAGGEFHVPPAGQHADEAEARTTCQFVQPGSPMSALRRHPLVLARLESSARSGRAWRPGAGLVGGRLATSATRRARSSRMRRSRRARAGAAPNAHTGGPAGGDRGYQRGRMIKVEVSDLAAERAPGGAFVDLFLSGVSQDEAPPLRSRHVPAVSILPNLGWREDPADPGGLVVGRRPGTARSNTPPPTREPEGPAGRSPGGGLRPRPSRVVCLTCGGPGQSRGGGSAPG